MLQASGYIYNSIFVFVNHYYNCRPLSEFETALFENQIATITTSCGSIFNAILDHCNDSGNASYVLSHQNHHTGELDEVVSQQSDYRYTVPNVQLSTSGAYFIRTSTMCTTIQGVLLYKNKTLVIALQILLMILCNCATV